MEVNMQALKALIRQEAIVSSENVLKVDSFLNHQLDTELLVNMGHEFASYFKKKQQITKVVTVETSGIPIAVTTAIALNVPVLYARKLKTTTFDKEMYSAPAFSYTKRIVNRIMIAKKFLMPKDNVLIIDDFIAHGEVTLALISLIKQANATVAGIGTIIEKTFQGGGQKLRDAGYEVYALARIKKLIPPDNIEFLEE